jgi:putative colanic acid biosynthesis UDP-glucose lipid carrier transferase
MVFNRTRGIAHTFILAELAVVTACYWVSVLLWEIIVGVQSHRLSTYLFYNEFLVLGLLLVTQRSKRSLMQQEHGAGFANRMARRQSIFAMLAVFAAAAAVGDRNIPRGFLFAFAPVLYVVLLVCNRRLPGWLARCLFVPADHTRVLLVGDPGRLAFIRPWLESKRDLGLCPIGYCSDTAEAPPDSALPRLGGPDDLERTIERHRIDQVILVELIRLQDLLRGLTGICERRGIRLLAVSDLDEHFRHSVTFIDDDGVQLIGLREEPLEDPVNRLLKRALDIAVSLPVVLFILPVTTFIVWLLQRAQSPGPIFHTQSRAGLQNRPFRIYKYRTMHPNHGQEARQAGRDDDRIYPAGHWLRRFSIDELPQFLNVLRGEMSVVGPRPHLTDHNAAFARAMNNYHVRAMVKPGISGLAQINGFRGETRTDQDIIKRVSADIDYLENWSLSLDCKIILGTVRQIFFPPLNAY